MAQLDSIKGSNLLFATLRSLLAKVGGLVSCYIYLETEKNISKLQILRKKFKRLESEHLFAKSLFTMVCD